ncbi:MAG: TRAP transporter substrate-binding protein DctP [Candidatus Korobacteraceae bacterium]|jgi:TRAP-type C4-dicarboxylate transport system substrate-binding protein
MTVTRRGFVLGALATPTLAMLSRYGLAVPTQNLKISHQFPASTGLEGDFRDRICHKFADEIKKRTNGALTATVWPGSSMMKTNAQLNAVRGGSLDMSLFPISYAGGEIPELNIGLMPGIVTSYEQGLAWKNAEAGKLLSQVLSDKGVLFVSWVWQAGGVASRAKAIVEPEDSKGLKIRGGSREMDMVLKAAGASVVSLPSNEIYQSVQSGALDAAMTSSTSLISFRLEEVAKHLTTGRGKAYWFMLEPLLISRKVFETLPKDMQMVVMTVGAELEKYGTEAAKADDQAVAKVYQKAGGKVYDLSAATVKRWQAIARETAWKDYAARNERCARLLQAAEKLL